MKELIKRIAINAGTLASGSVLSSMIGLVTFSLLAKELGKELFGVIAVVQVYAVVVDGVMNFQSWQALIKYGTGFQIDNKLAELGQLFSFGLLIDVSTAVLATVVGVLLPMYGLGDLLGWEDIKVEMAGLFAVSILFHIEGTPTAIFRMFDKYRVFVIRGLIAAGFKLVLVVYGIWTGQNVWYFFYSLLGAQIFSYLFFLIWAVVFLKRKKIPLVWPDISRKRIEAMYPGVFNFVLTTNLHGTIRMMTLRLDTIIVDAYLGSAATGLYQVAKQFSKVFTQVSQPLYKVVYPELTKLWEQGKKLEFVALVKRFSWLALLFGLIVWLCFFFFSDLIIYYTVGEEYYSSIPILLFYLAGVVLSVSAFPITPAILAMGRPDISFKVQLSSTIVYFVTLMILLNILGVIGAGVAYLALYLAWIVIMFGTYHVSLRGKLKMK